MRKRGARNNYGLRRRGLRRLVGLGLREIAGVFSENRPKIPLVDGVGVGTTRPNQGVNYGGLRGVGLPPREDGRRVRLGVRRSAGSALPHSRRPRMGLGLRGRRKAWVAAASIVVPSTGWRPVGHVAISSHEKRLEASLGVRGASRSRVTCVLLRGRSQPVLLHSEPPKMPTFGACAKSARPREHQAQQHSM